LHIVQLMPLHPKTPSSLASFKSRLVLPFWYRLTQVVVEKRPLNRCSSSNISPSTVACMHILGWLHGNLVDIPSRQREKSARRLVMLPTVKSACSQRWSTRQIDDAQSSTVKMA